MPSLSSSKRNRPSFPGPERLRLAMTSGHKNHTLRAVLFDLGETLLDPGGDSPSFADQAEEDFGAVYRYLQQQGKPLPDWPDFFQAIYSLFQSQRQVSFATDTSLHVGTTIQEALARMGVALSEAEIRACVRLTFQYSDDHAVLYPQVIPLLEQLQAQGLATGLISNTIWPGWCQDETLERLGIRDLLHPRIYSADVPFTKPHPSIFLRALELLGLEPDQAVYVGDNLDPDICGAQGVGMKAILFRPPYRQDGHPGITPHATVGSLDEIPEALARLFPGAIQKGETT